MDRFVAIAIHRGVDRMLRNANRTFARGIVCRNAPRMNPDLGPQCGEERNRSLPRVVECRGSAPHERLLHLVRDCRVRIARLHGATNVLISKCSVSRQPQ